MATATPARTPLRRAPEGRLLGGVCAGIARRAGVDPLVPRIAFVVAATAGGFGAVVYVLLWLLLPAEDAGAGAGAPATRRPDRASVEVALGIALLVAAVLLALRELGWWFSDALVWPTALVAGGAALIWRQAQREPPERAPATSPAGAAPGVARDRVAVVSRAGIGVALVVAAGVVFLQLTGALEAVRDVALAALAVAVVLGAIFAPLAARLVRSLAAERDARVRSQERSELAAHLHDSVLQTLALVQQRAEDPRAVAALARRQERELRGWLAGRTAGATERLAPALEAVANEVEADHGVEVEVVVVGDAVLDDRRRALVAATREAVVNAAKFGGGSAVSVFAETSGDEVRVFVRDRGPGFDAEQLPADRRGVRESILGRMARHGGRAAVRTAPGAGTEVELVLP